MDNDEEQAEAMQCPICGRYTATISLAKVRLGSDDRTEEIFQCMACHYRRIIGD